LFRQAFLLGLLLVGEERIDDELELERGGVGGELDVEDAQEDEL